MLMSYTSGRLKFIKPDEVAGAGAVVPCTDIRGNADPDAHTGFVYNRHAHLPLDAQREQLPIFPRRAHLLYLLERHQSLVLAGETGSGKSTQLPQYLYETGYCKNHGQIVVTSPRVSAAVSLANRVAKEQNTVCSKEGHVGYAVSFDAQCGAHTKIKYVTEGILLREMFSDPLLTQYSCIILDEVHERSQLTDVIMGLVKKILKKRKNLKLIICSATMNAEFLRDFFDFNKNVKTPNKKSTAAILSITGKMHPVEIFYVEAPVPDYIKATIDTIIKIHEKEPFGDILAFLTGQDEIVSTCRILKDYAEEKNKSQKTQLLILPMYGSLPYYEQLKVFKMADMNVRKVIIATNIAETSLTIHGINYVIDCGFHKVKYFDSGVAFDSLVVCPISQANAIQRAGRAGRVAPGKCYREVRLFNSLPEGIRKNTSIEEQLINNNVFRLYTEEAFKQMSENVPPEMQRSDLSAVVLQLKALGIHNVLRFSFPSPPAAKILLSAIEVLYAIGAINKDGELTNPLGTNMAELPLPPRHAKILCVSGEFGCLEEMLSIVSMLQVESVFIKPAGGQAAINAKIAKRNNFEVAEGDLITLLNVYECYMKQRNITSNYKSIKDWCRRLFLNEKALEKVLEIRKSLEKLCKNKFKIVNKTTKSVNAARTENILRCICSGFFMGAAFLHHSGTYRSPINDILPLYICPTSCLYNAQQPQWVAFATVQTSSEKTYMRNISVIDKTWLLELAPHYYKEN